MRSNVKINNILIANLPTKRSFLKGSGGRTLWGMRALSGDKIEKRVGSVNIRKIQRVNGGSNWRQRLAQFSGTLFTKAVSPLKMPVHACQNSI
jgi:hypothetical protein